jgi:uncharacterized protein
VECAVLVSLPSPWPPTPPRRVSRRQFLRAAAAAPAGGILAALAACDVREFARRHGAKQRLSIATAGTGGVYYVRGGGIAKVVSAHVPHAEATAELTAGAIDNLKPLARGAVDLAITSADTLADAYAGREAFGAMGRVPVAALATLFPGYTHAVTLADRGIRALPDLRGRLVSTNAPGNAAEPLALRLLVAAGLDPARDVRRARLSAAESAEALKDGKIDAFFGLSGVPNPAVRGLASSVAPGALRLLPSGGALPELRRRYRTSVYRGAVIPKGAYAGLSDDVPVVGVDNLLVADPAMSEALAYEIVRVLLARRAELVAVHPEARHIRLDSAAAGSPVPFHPGAVRYYREAGVWRG